MMAKEQDRVLVDYMLECIGRIEKYIAGQREKFFTSDLIPDLVKTGHQVTCNYLITQHILL
jgi:hypothetical protein